MKLFENVKKAIIYKFTNKPDCYVHVDNPKTLQDLRQIQYNNWCKVKGVFNGSFLPINPDKLNDKSKKGWIEITSTSNKQVSIEPFKENLVDKLLIIIVKLKLKKA